MVVVSKDLFLGIFTSKNFGGFEEHLFQTGGQNKTPTRHYRFKKKAQRKTLVELPLEQQTLFWKKKACAGHTTFRGKSWAAAKKLDDPC